MRRADGSRDRAPDEKPHTTQAGTGCATGLEVHADEEITPPAPMRDKVTLCQGPVDTVPPGEDKERAVSSYAIALSLRGRAPLPTRRYLRLPQNRWMRLQASSRSEVFVA